MASFMWHSSSNSHFGDFFKPKNYGLHHHAHKLDGLKEAKKI
jgi:hypothetical protein